MRLQPLEVLENRLKRVNCSSAAYGPCSDQGVLTYVGTSVYHNHAGTQQEFKQVRFDGFVTATKIDLSLDVVAQLALYSHAI
jgi:hypothetical protein